MNTCLLDVIFVDSLVIDSAMFDMLPSLPKLLLSFILNRYNVIYYIVRFGPLSLLCLVWLSLLTY